MDINNELSLREKIRINLINAMNKTGYTQVKLADALGISKGTVNNWIRGNNSPDVDMIPNICRILDTTIAELYSSGVTDTNEEPATNDGDGLSEAEAAMLKLFRMVPAESQGLVLGMIEAALKSRGL